ncbi:MAG: J domain-containing protein [Symploca sp. SIO3C6]|uniref:J domain-containing protein n=1 Tax=Symploca sp. SIO1C4 TaxID=2607765 RepID=A0A6B3NHS5_9CYAN|nr:J domain-containing protein [Symploca sp. SIO3C6]NER31223.1 J domain-containing protein [Symploca sp. SIO1C4]NET08595.1 J domain-containing protein [Symploca sp. SIO2B6]NET53670.1 J domain-containing protein [Merismopedia sp. SIO2A8]
MIEVERYYRVLELEPGATAEEVHQGYLDMTWVWHPDRFVDHPRLQKKAHHKLQELNEAHERLRSFHATPRQQNLRAKSKSQVYRHSSRYSSDKSLTQKFSQSAETRAASGNSRKNNKKFVRRSVIKTSDFDEWLD